MDELAKKKPKDQLAKRNPKDKLDNRKTKGLVATSQHVLKGLVRQY